MADSLARVPPGGVFWSSRDGRTVIVRHTDAVFELLRDGGPVMPTARFESLCAYVWAEFPDAIPPELR